mgnify:CR=1 FL=1
MLCVNMSKINNNEMLVWILECKIVKLMTLILKHTWISRFLLKFNKKLLKNSTKKMEKCNEFNQQFSDPEILLIYLKNEIKATTLSFLLPLCYHNEKGKIKQIYFVAVCFSHFSHFSFIHLSNSLNLLS